MVKGPWRKQSKQIKGPYLSNFLVSAGRGGRGAGYNCGHNCGYNRAGGRGGDECDKNTLIILHRDFITLAWGP